MTLALGLILVEGFKLTDTKKGSNVEDTAKNKRSLSLLFGQAWSGELGKESLGTSTGEWASYATKSEGLDGGWLEGGKGGWQESSKGWAEGVESTGWSDGGLEKEHKIITIVKETKIPVTIEKKVPYPVYKEIPYPVHVKVPQPYPVEKIVEVPVKVAHPIHEVIHKPVPFEKIVKVPIEVNNKIYFISIIKKTIFR